MKEQLVYIIRASDSGRIKIGMAIDPVQRMADLQTGSPEVLVLVGAVPGGQALESRLHAQLHRSRLHGEWFEFTDEVALAVGDLLGWGKPTPQQVDSMRKLAELEVGA